MEHVDLAELRSAPRKVRKLDPVHIKEIAGAISALGFCVHAPIGKNNVVLDGVARIEAAKLLDLSRVLCLRIDLSLLEPPCCLLRLVAETRQAAVGHN